MTETMSFQEALFRFVKGCQKVVAENDKFYSNVTFNTMITADPKSGRRYVRVIKSDNFSNRIVFCFIDKTNGDVLKAASWKTPAKHARGNIYDEYNGLKYVGPYGPAYLR